MASLIGKRFNNWTVIDEYRERRLRLICRCECGNIRDLDGYTVKNNISKSCGCTRSKPNRNSRSYSSWVNMVARCSNMNAPYYKYYGGKGIKVCERWLSFDNFFEDMGEAPKGLTLERIDGNKNYSKENCIWATRKEQQNNLSSNHNITFNNETKSITAWAEKLGINVRTLRNRILRGWSIELAFNPEKRKGQRIEKTAHSL